MNRHDRRRPFVGAAVLVAVALLAPCLAASEDSVPAARPGVTFGGRAAYYRPKAAEHGTLNGGAQLRWHLSEVLAVEGSADYRQSKFGGTTVDIFPVQASLLVYLTPSWRVSPFILGGVGWYYTHVQGVSGTTNRYGPHAGAGLEIALDPHWTIDGSYRYLWTQSLTAPTVAHPAGENFSDQGFLLTAGLNYRF
jgi:opacity protein-like surface antigen